MTERDIVQRLRETIVNETPARYPDVIEAAITEIERLRAANDRVGKWLSAAIDDPGVCQEMKDDIAAWFVASEQRASETP
jgi:hypothetical protein